MLPSRSSSSHKLSSIHRIHAYTESAQIAFKKLITLGATPLQKMVSLPIIKTFTKSFKSSLPESPLLCPTSPLLPSHPSHDAPAFTPPIIPSGASLLLPPPLPLSPLPSPTLTSLFQALSSILPSLLPHSSFPLLPLHYTPSFSYYLTPQFTVIPLQHSITLLSHSLVSIHFSLPPKLPASLPSCPNPYCPYIPSLDSPPLFTSPTFRPHHFPPTFILHPLALHLQPSFPLHPSVQFSYY